MGDTQSGRHMAKPPGLRLRGNSWGVRVRVPDRLRPALPTEIVRSLGQMSFKEACRKGWQERAAIDRLFQRTEEDLKAATRAGPRQDDSLSDAQLRTVARRCLHELEKSHTAVPFDEEAQQDLATSLCEEAMALSHPRALDDAGLQSFADGFAERFGMSTQPGENRYLFLDAVRLAYATHLERQVARITGATVANESPIFSASGEEIDVPSSLTLAQAVELYVSAPERAGNTEKSLGLDRSRLRPLCDIIGKDKPVAAIAKADLRTYVEQLAKLPSSYTKLYPDLSVEEAIAAGRRAGKMAFSATSIERAIQATRLRTHWS